MWQVMGGCRMIELPVGTKFYYDDDLIEVVERKTRGKCSKCFLKNKFINNEGRYNEMDICYTVACQDEERKDEKDVTFKKVEE